MTTSIKHKAGIGIIATLWLAVVFWLVIQAITTGGVIAL